MADVLIKGGEVVDGTGAAPFAADVRVRGGVIVEVAPDLTADGEQVIDATGAFVTPGIIDTHTHLDGAMWWDPDLDPLPSQGNTSTDFRQLRQLDCTAGRSSARRSRRSAVLSRGPAVEAFRQEAAVELGGLAVVREGHFRPADRGAFRWLHRPCLAAYLHHGRRRLAAARHAGRNPADGSRTRRVIDGRSDGPVHQPFRP